MSSDHDHTNVDGLSETTGENDNDATVLMSEATTTTTIITIGDATPEPLPPMYSPPAPVVAAATLPITPHGDTTPDPSLPTPSDNNDVLQPPPAVAINLIMDTEPVSGLPPPPYAKFPRNNGRETTILVGPPSHDGRLATSSHSQFRDPEKSSRKKNLLVCGMFCAFFLGWGYFALRIAGLI